MISNSFPTVDEENEEEIHDENQVRFTQWGLKKFYLFFLIIIHMYIVHTLQDNKNDSTNQNGTMKKRHNSLDSCIGEAHFHSIKADPNCVTEESSLDDLDDLNSQTGNVNTPKTVIPSTELPDYENFSSIRKLKKSKSFNAHLEKPPRYSTGLLY